ncbi:MAG: cob(I)yrinic acid a,c-diamide adenosyltransferase [Saprospiraceae bacterium]
MKIYTKTGDDGTTSLYGGKRISKADLRVESYGAIDELNSWIGLISDEIKDISSNTILKEIQDRLFTIGSHLASDPDGNLSLPDLKIEDIQLLENEMDNITALVSPLRHFILPGGNRIISEIHVARTVCRRAERVVIALHQIHAVEQFIIIYLNRLSDYLFLLSRKIAFDMGTNEIKWIPRK